MSEKFQIVLYYKKRIIIGGKPSIETLVTVKKKFANFDDNDMNDILDQYLDDKRGKGREEVVSTWAMIYDDKKFMENVLKVENDESFVEWEERSKEIIKQKIIEL